MLRCGGVFARMLYYGCVCELVAFWVCVCKNVVLWVCLRARCILGVRLQEFSLWAIGHVITVFVRMLIAECCIVGVLLARVMHYEYVLVADV